MIPRIDILKFIFLHAIGGQKLDYIVREQPCFLDSYIQQHAEMLFISGFMEI